MRTYIRLLAPLSILATALYLAFLAKTSAESKSFPITTVDNQNSNLVPPVNQTGGRLASDTARNTTPKEVRGTSKPNRP